MSIRLSVKWEGDAPDLAERRLSLSAFGEALRSLLLALRRIATNIVSEAVGERQANVGRFTDGARQLDIEITSLVKNSSGFDSLVTLATPLGKTFPLFADLPENAAKVLLNAIKAESHGVLTNAVVRRYLESLPSGITQQTYQVYRNGEVLQEVSLGTMSFAQVPLDVPYIAEYIGRIVGVGFEPGKSEVRIKTDTATEILAATPEQVETALQLRHTGVRAMAVVQGNSQRLLILQEAQARIHRFTRESAIFERWNGVLTRLAQ
jgi:hypothetical protein